MSSEVRFWSTDDSDMCVETFNLEHILGYFIIVEGNYGNPSWGNAWMILYYCFSFLNELEGSGPYRFIYLLKKKGGSVQKQKRKRKPKVLLQG